jgi:hypothetical protein
MKARKRILNIRKQSRINLPKENLWFFSEVGTINQSSVPERKSFRKDRLSILNDDYDRYSLENSEKNRNKKECSFVVDWQMSDTF